MCECMHACVRACVCPYMCVHIYAYIRTYVHTHTYIPCKYTHMYPCRALIRPGRFDSTVTITLPDVKARHDILKVHSAKVKLDPDVDLEIIARGTSGFSGWFDDRRVTIM